MNDSWLKSLKVHHAVLLDEGFEYLFRNYVFYSQSIEDYVNKKKPSLRRRVINHTITVNAFIASILYLALSIRSNRGVTLYLG